MSAVKTRNRMGGSGLLPFITMPVCRIGVVYCTSNISAEGRETEKKADAEVVEVARAVKAALEGNGYIAELVDLDPNCFFELSKYHIIFNLTETIYGFPLMDFEIAHQMEQMNLCFTGSGSASLKSCLDKSVTKAILKRHNLPTPRYEVFQEGMEISSCLHFPLFVKPVHEDGSIGITKDALVINQEELRARVATIHSSYVQPALVEEYIDGRDITVSILGNGSEVVVLPPSECVYLEHDGPRILTFDAKWETESEIFQKTIGRCPCDLSAETEKKIMEIALKAYEVMGCRDYARVDFRVDGETPYILEVNPNPCINPDDTGFVRSGNAGGYTYPQIVNRILACALTGRKQVTYYHKMEGAVWQLR